MWTFLGRFKVVIPNIEWMLRRIQQQCFSTDVPWSPFKCTAIFWTFIFYYIGSKIKIFWLKFSKWTLFKLFKKLFRHKCAAKFFLGSCVPRAKKGWEPLLYNKLDEKYSKSKKIANQKKYVHKWPNTLLADINIRFIKR